MKVLFSLLLGCSLIFATPVFVAQAQPNLSQKDKQQAQKLAKSGKAAFAAEDYKKALESFEKAYALNPEIEYAVSVGQCHYELGQYEEAITAYSLFLVGAEPKHKARPAVDAKLLEAKDALQKTRREQSLTANTKGEEHFAAARFTESLNSFQSAYDLMPSPELLYKIAQCHDKLSQYTEALAALDTLLQDKAASTLLLTEAKQLQTSLQEKQAKAFFTSGRYQEALALFQELYQADAQLTRLVDMGNCYEKLGQEKEALASYQTFVEKAPNDNPQRALIAAKLKQEKALDNEAIPEGQNNKEAKTSSDLSKPTEAELPKRLLIGSVVSAGLGITAGSLAIVLAQQVQAAGERRDVPTITTKQKQRAALAAASDGLFVVALATGGLGIILHQRTKKAEKNTSATLLLTPTGVSLGLEY
jgi:tetratricopeptide (TPR) repeat protein